MTPPSFKTNSSYKTKIARAFLRSLTLINKQRPASKSLKDVQLKGERIKMAAYSSMARSVGSRRAWSRAFLSKLRTRAGRRHGSTVMVMRKRCIIGAKKKRVIAENKATGEIQQAQKLRGLVPGGQAMDFCDLLDETAHYIKCLATQVKLMQGIADHFYSSN